MKNNFEIWKLSDNKEESDYLFNLVKNGIKTATSYLYDDTFKEPCKYSYLSNWEGSEKILLETTKCYVVKFCEVSEEHAKKEGEGSKSLTEWRLIHKEFFTKQLALRNKFFSENIKIVCEEFRKIDNFA